MSFPHLFYIEVVLGCNLSCPECPMGTKSIVRHHNMMSLNQYVSLIDKIAPYANEIFLFVWGEPTLHPQLPEMIGYAKKIAKITVSTNANLITREMAKRIMAVKPDVVYVPLDAVSEETYQIIRAGGSFEKALNGLKFLKEFQTSETTIFGQFVVFQNNAHELPLFKTLCDGLQIPMRINMPLIFNNNLAPDINWRRPHYSSLASVRENMKSCEARIRMIALNNGDVVPCCFDYNSSVIFGNLFKQSVQEIWLSPTYVDFRAKVGGEGPLPPDFCLKHCPRFTMDDVLKSAIDKTKAGE